MQNIYSGQIARLPRPPPPYRKSHHTSQYGPSCVDIPIDEELLPPQTVAVHRRAPPPDAQGGGQYEDPGGPRDVCRQAPRGPAR